MPSAKGGDVNIPVKHALLKLQASVQNLEKAVEAKKSAASAVKKGNTGQPDLFALKQQQNQNALNVTAIARRLDTAIHQVEEILKEGRA
jgi:hypothetical protein